MKYTLLDQKEEVWQHRKLAVAGKDSIHILDHQGHPVRKTKTKSENVHRCTLLYVVVVIYVSVMTCLCII